MQHQLLVALLLWLLPLCAHAQNGQLAAMRNTVPESYNFWLYAPREYTHEHQKVPVIIFLHGASLCGRNLDKVRRYGPLDAIVKGRDIDALTLINIIEGAEVFAVNIQYGKKK